MWNHLKTAEILGAHPQQVCPTFVVPAAPEQNLHCHGNTHDLFSGTVRVEFASGTKSKQYG